MCFFIQTQKRDRLELLPTSFLIISASSADIRTRKKGHEVAFQESRASGLNCSEVCVCIYKRSFESNFTVVYENLRISFLFCVNYEI